MSALVAGLAACQQPPAVTPLDPAVRASVSQVLAEVHGETGTGIVSHIGARGSGEGGARGAAGVAQGGCFGAACLGMPIAVILGSIVGAAAAHAPEQVDQARAALRSALEETDVSGLLRSSLARSGRSGAMQITVAAHGAAGEAVHAASAHILSIEYTATYMVLGNVSPDLQVIVIARGRLLAPGRAAQLHAGTWMYCSAKASFLEMGKDRGARARAELARAAKLLGAAISYDTFISTTSRSAGCMDFSNVPEI